MEVDIREAGHWLRMKGELTMLAQRDGVQVIPLVVNEGLDLFDDERSKKGSKVLRAELSDGSPVGVIQDSRESGVELLLPRALHRGEKVVLNLKMEAEHAFLTWEG